ncbi:probable cytochrome P450 313a2 [Euwallacea fornicatus]|uniref:probable cytochrome P450 313a2 n=1 Tax=Euwallacea fornicatus TaxID=995702 RepID=UPI00338D5408
MVLSLVGKYLLYVLLGIILYNTWILCTKYRIVRFSWSQNGWWLPLLPFIGNCYLTILKGNVINAGLWCDRYLGLPINIWYGNKYHYISNNLDDARILLNHPKCLDKAQFYDHIKRILSNSILLISGEKWKGRRRYLRSAFNTNMINTYIPTFYRQCCNLVELIKEKKPEDDHYKFFNTHTFLCFFLTSLGDGAEDDLDSKIIKFAHRMDTAQDGLIKLLMNPLIPTWIWSQTSLGTKLNLHKRKANNLLTNILTKKKAKMAKNSEYVENTSELPLLELLLNDEYGYKAGEFDMLEEFFLFATAATDTTGHTFTFIFTLLGMFPDIQQKAYEEVMSVAGDEEIDNVMLSKLEYTEAVINETMRIFPAIPVVGRYCSEDIQLQNQILPEGANMGISIFHIQRNPEYWDDPLKFDPSRFLPENSEKIKPGSFLPFSSGPRNCIGMRMAIVLLKITVATVLRRFKITSNHKDIKEFKLTSCISMRTTNHLDLHFTPRNENEL